MSKETKLTPVEWEIMDAIWRIGGSPSIREVLENAFPKGEKAYTTVQTFMNILVKKGLLTSKKIGLVNFYSPVKSREEIVSSEIKSIIGRVFNGSIPAMASFLFNSKEIGVEEIAVIKELLDKKEHELREKKND